MKATDAAMDRRRVAIHPSVRDARRWLRDHRTEVLAYRLAEMEDGRALLQYIPTTPEAE